MYPWNFTHLILIAIEMCLQYSFPLKLTRCAHVQIMVFVLIDRTTYLPLQISSSYSRECSSFHCHIDEITEMFSIRKFIYRYCLYFNTLLSFLTSSFRYGILFFIPSSFATFPLYLSNNFHTYHWLFTILGLINLFVCNLKKKHILNYKNNVSFWAVSEFPALINETISTKWVIYKTCCRMRIDSSDIMRTAVEFVSFWTSGS